MTAVTARLPCSSSVGRRSVRNQGGVIMVSAILLLVVITIFAIAMFRSFGLEEKIATNVRDKERATQSAMAALQYAEWWLAQAGNGLTPKPCTAGLLDANAGQTVLCSNSLASLVGGVGAIANVPWNNDTVGTIYTPPNMNVSNTGGINKYYAAPRFYVQFIGNSTTLNCGNVYLIDAWGYGGSDASKAVVESTYQLYFNDCIKG